MSRLTNHITPTDVLIVEIRLSHFRNFSIIFFGSINICVSTTSKHTSVALLIRTYWTHMYTYVRMYVSWCTCTYSVWYVYTCTHMCTCSYLCCICMYICVQIYICMYTYVYIDTYQEVQTIHEHSSFQTPNQTSHGRFTPMFTEQSNITTRFLCRMPGILAIHPHTLWHKPRTRICVGSVYPDWHAPVTEPVDATCQRLISSNSIHPHGVWQCTPWTDFSVMASSSLPPRVPRRAARAHIIDIHSVEGQIHIKKQNPPWPLAERTWIVTPSGTVAGMHGQHERVVCVLLAIFIWPCFQTFRTSSSTPWNQIL